MSIKISVTYEWSSLRKKSASDTQIFTLTNISEYITNEVAKFIRYFKNGCRLKPYREKKKKVPVYRSTTYTANLAIGACLTIYCSG